MSAADIVSELLYAGKSLVEVAGYDDIQIRWVIFRPRNKNGRLLQGYQETENDQVDGEGMRVVRDPVPFARMFYQIQRLHGCSLQEAERRWQAYLDENPKLGIGGEEQGSSCRQAKPRDESTEMVDE